MYRLTQLYRLQHKVHWKKIRIKKGLRLGYGHNCKISIYSGGSRGGSEGAMDPPFLPSSLVQAYRLGEILDLLEPPYLTNSNKVLTVAHLRVFF